MLWIFGIGVLATAAAAAAAAAVLNNNQIPKTGFSCEGRTTGYYADVESGCQVYHMCDGLGRQFSYTCPNATLFQQRMLICDHWYMVNCSRSVHDYTANLRIGQKMPFVDDSESNPYHRTPRPDLLSHPSQSEYDIIYRTGRAQYGTNLNLVGAEPNKNNTTSATDEPTYSLPSHWSTEYDQHSTTSKPNKVVFNTKKIGEQGNGVKGKPISTGTTTEVPVNYKSYFKNTTPVYPTSVDVSTVDPEDAGLVPPLPYQRGNKNEEVETSTENNTPHVNFPSNFTATTPVYPQTVDITSEKPADVGILPPSNGTDNGSDVPVAPLSVDILPPPADVSFNPANRPDNNEPELPSKFYQPPKFEPNFSEPTKPKEEVNQMRHGGFKALGNNEWEDLRKKFLIPDYEFPLETISRPSYDSLLSSFQASGDDVKE